MIQIPNPGSHCLKYRGDFLWIKLILEEKLEGKAFFRTTLGKARLLREEVLEHVETGRSTQGQAWHDLEMDKINDYEYAICLGMMEIGHFEGKCLFFEEGKKDPAWINGENISINIAPAEYSANNTLYCAFVRQFGKNKNKSIAEDYHEVKEFEKKGYHVIPQSGTFRDLKKELNFIINELGCKIIHLLPINPTPTVYGKMGIFGSPYAALDFTAVNPELAEFDKKATPLEQFCELVDEVHLLNGKIFIDIAINHTGWAAKVHEEHPEWLVRDNTGEIKSPGAWGTTWEDLTELNHTSFELWKYLGNVFVTWCERGVDGFRCDAGYMIPANAWQYIISYVRQFYPDTIFLLEGLGGDLKVTENLLNFSDMNWAYSELFQNYSKEQICNYMQYANYVDERDGLMFHYVETHDNERLANSSYKYAKLRTALCAMLSNCGGFGITNGVEWFAKQRVNVHSDSALNWGSEENQVKYLSRINKVLHWHKGFHAGAKIKFLWTSNENVLAFLRTPADGKDRLLILLNLNTENIENSEFERTDLALNGKRVNLLTDEKIDFFAVSDVKIGCALQPAECVLVSEEDVKTQEFVEKLNLLNNRRDPAQWQWTKGIVMEYLFRNRGTVKINEEMVEKYAEIMLDSPTEFFRQVSAEQTCEVKAIEWKSPRDINRIVMIPPNYFLLVEQKNRFIIKISNGRNVICQLNSVRKNNNEYFVAFYFGKMKLEKEYNIELILFDNEKLMKEAGKLLVLSENPVALKTSFEHMEIVRKNLMFLDVNNRGGMCHIPIAWGEVYSKYDGLLAGNINDFYPVDRQVMFSRLRCWINYQGYSHGLDIKSLNRFVKNEQGDGLWYFQVPVGAGLFVKIILKLRMDLDKDKIYIALERDKCDNPARNLSDENAVRLILRPDVEDRSFHNNTHLKNYNARNYWSSVIHSKADSFEFAPDKERVLRCKMYGGKFFRNDEWYYDIHHQIEQSRGMEDKSDLFSPGYFEVVLNGGEESMLIASINDDIEVSKKIDYSSESIIDFDKLLVNSMGQFIVNRNKLKTVIAGYPWFLDWGRDTLIAARGLIKNGKKNGYLEDVYGILQAFARFEESGTLPNMIHGDDAENRETSDAPLWFFVAMQDYCHEIKSLDVLNNKPENCARTIKEIMLSIAENYLKGTSNGIKVDSDSMLVYSPTHYTWMDTNYPAGTPRQGYPIEIQALWFSAINFLAEITKEKYWQKIAIKIKESIMQYFYLEDIKCLSDCLHADNGFVPAKNAFADDAIRPNQLFAITLGAIDDKIMMKNILESTRELLIPGAIRTLADRSVKYHLPIFGNNGAILNDPANPYWGNYVGDEDTRRKPAYHNGTAWTWVFPSWSEAYFMAYEKDGIATAKSILLTANDLIENGCVGQLPEIVDGNVPHLQRGCDAQAWGITEYYRVWEYLKEKKEEQKK